MTIFVGMHTIEPFYRWLDYYNPAEDDQSPFFGKEYNYELYSENIYGYYIDPAWDHMGSETLYIKVLYTDYEAGYAILEFIGEWNDAINNDVMHLKRNVIDDLSYSGIDKYILIGENVLNFHGSDDSYYEEWFEESDWISTLGFPEHVTSEWGKYNIDSYFNFGGGLEFPNWRTMRPTSLFENLFNVISRRISL